MNPLEAELDYPFADQLPLSGSVLTVAPGLCWVRMDLPFALNHINLWLLEDRLDRGNGPEDGWTVVDCGIANDATRAAWNQIFEHELGGKPILRVIATHCHPDHVGLSGWLCEHWQAPLWMSAGEYAFARMMAAALPGADGSAAVPHFQRHGVVDSERLEQLRARKNYYPSLVPDVPSSYVRLSDGQEILIGTRSWRVITGFGHSPEHVSLFCEEDQLLISGDMLLPRISTNVSVFAIEPLANPVQQFLDSIARYEALPADTLVFPAHGKPFRQLQVRLRQLRDHHAQRLEEVFEACAKPSSAADIVPIMFKRALDSHQLTFALGEALAHLHQLWYAGRIGRSQGEDGILRFQQRANPAR